MTTITEPEPDPVPPGAPSPAFRVLCFTAFFVPLTLATLGGVAAWTQLLAGDSVPAMCGGGLLGLVLGAAAARLVVQWASQSAVTAAQGALLFVLLALTVSTYLVVYAQSEARQMTLLVHGPDSDVFVGREGFAVGEVVAFTGLESEVPDGWMIADGRGLPRAEHPSLGRAVGKGFGGDGETVRLPDLRGLFGTDLESLGESTPENRRSLQVTKQLRLEAPGDRRSALGAPVLWLIRVSE